MKKDYRLFYLLSCFLLSCPLYAQSNWVRCSEGLPAGKTVMALTHIGPTLFAATQKGGVYKSTDNGSSWQATPSHNSLSQTSTSSLAAMDTFIFAAQVGHGILRSSLHDTLWSLLDSGLSNKHVQDILAVGSTLYTATYGGGVFFSTNLGNSWSVLNGNAGMEDLRVFSLAANSTTLFAGTAGTNSIPDTGVAYRTTFGGPRFLSVSP